MRGILAVFVVLLTACNQAAALPPVPSGPPPPLYVYIGSSCNIDHEFAEFRNFLGRKEDGAAVFGDPATPTRALNNLNYGLGCYQGKVKNIAVGLFPEFVAGDTPDGPHTFADVAAGKLDQIYSKMGAAVVAHGFPDAYVRLGWEFNGNWYFYAASQNRTAWKAAFSHISAILHATPGSHFTVVLNPSTNADASGELPTSGVDAVCWDVYENIYVTRNATSEPAAWNAAFSGWWGIDSMATWGGQYPHCVPEFGVGGGKIVDDPEFMTYALGYFEQQKVMFVGYWDSNVGATTKISDGSKPATAIAFQQVFGGPTVRSLLAGASLATDMTAVVSRGAHALLAKRRDGRYVLLIWGPTIAGKPAALTYSLNRAVRVQRVDGNNDQTIGPALTTAADTPNVLNYTGGLVVLEAAPT